MVWNKMCRGLVVTLGLLALSVSAWGQGTSSQATGVVTDPSGAAVPGATVVLTNEGTNQRLTTKTTSAGVYVFDAIPTGTYAIAVSKSGFKTFTSTSNVVTIGQPMTVNVKLEIGAVSQQVVVKGAAQLVQTSSSGNFGNVVNQQTIQQLPIVGTRGRNPLSLVYFQPGVVTGCNTGGCSNVNGGRDRAWNYTLDGIGINEYSAGGSETAPVNTNPDSIGEFRLITSNLTAQYGSTSGGQVAMITRSGTNQFHGEGFWFYQTPRLNANNYFNNLDGLGRSDFVQNIWGGSVGGPILKNHTFFFTNVQFLHAHESIVEHSPVLTADARAGTFRYIDPSTCGNLTKGCQNSPSYVDANGDPNPGITVDSYNVAASNPQGLGLDPTLQNYIKLTPLPNDFKSIGDGLNIASYTWDPPETQKNVDLTVRIDHEINSSNAIFGRWYQGHQNTIADIVNGGLPAFPGTQNVVDTYRKPTSLALGWTSSFSRTVTNQFVLGYEHYLYNFANPDPKYASNPPYDLVIGSNPLQNYIGNLRAITVPQINDDLTWVHGAHTFKMGFHLQQIIHVDDRGSIGGWDAEPYVNFDPGIDTVSTSAFNIPTSGSNRINSNDLSDLDYTINDLLGRVGTMGQGFTSNAAGTAYQPGGSKFNFRLVFPAYEFYGQDTWRVRPNIAVDLGLRLDAMPTPSDPRNRLLAPNQPVIVGSEPTDTVAWAPGNLYKSSNALLGPSVGVAWDPFGTGKTSVRAHYGIYYNPVNTFSISSGVIENLVGFNYGVTNVAYGESGGLLRNGLPTLAPPSGLTPKQLRQPPPFSPSGVTVMDPHWRPSEVMEWGLSLGRAFASKMVLTLNYLGSHGEHLYGGYNANQAIISPDFLQAFKTVAAGGDSPLMDQLLSAIVPSGQTGSQYVQRHYPSTLSHNSVGALADSLGRIEVNGMGLPQASGLSPYFFFPLPQFAGAFDVLDSHDWSNYNAFQVQLQRRFSPTLTFQVSYAFAKSLDTRSFDPTFTRVNTGLAQSASSTPYDIHDRSINYAPSDFDRTHSLQGEWVWNLPFGSGQRWGSRLNPVLRSVIGGWTAAGILTLSSGRPFTVYSGAFTFDGDVETPANCSGCSHNMASLHTNPADHNNRYLFTPDQIARFSTPAAGELGNTGRNFFRLPWQFDTDMDFAKRIYFFSEGRYLEIRADATNIFNHPNYDLADSSTITSSVFSRARDSVDNTERHFQLGLKFYF